MAVIGFAQPQSVFRAELHRLIPSSKRSFKPYPVEHGKRALLFAECSAFTISCPFPPLIANGPNGDERMCKNGIFRFSTKRSRSQCCVFSLTSLPFGHLL